MSIRLVADVLDRSQTRATTKLLMVAIADSANEEGIAWPSQETIARRAGVTARTVRRLVQEAVDTGELEIVKPGNGRKSTVYRVRADKMTAQGGQPRPPRVDTAMSTEPSLNQGGDKSPPAAGESREDRNRRRDELWDEFERCAGHMAISKAERGRWGKAQVELLELGATAPQFRQAWREYRRVYPGAAINPQAIVAHWGELVGPPVAATAAETAEPCPDCDDGWNDVEGELIRCTSCGGSGKRKEAA